MVTLCAAQTFERKRTAASASHGSTRPSVAKQVLRKPSRLLSSWSKGRKLPASWSMPILADPAFKIATLSDVRSPDAMLAGSISRNAYCGSVLWSLGPDGCDLFGHNRKHLAARKGYIL